MIFDFLKKIRFILFSLYDQKNLGKLIKRADFIKFQFFYRAPSLKKNSKNESLCTSCNDCVTACPNGALTLKVNQSIQFNLSDKKGSPPLKLLLDNSLCISCGDCIDVCPESALSCEKKGVGVVDLTK